MQKNKLKIKKAIEPTALPSTINVLLKDEAISGKLIIVASLLALLAANSPLQDTYNAFWHQTFAIGFDNLQVSMSLQHWVSEGLMAIFFLVVGLEIKRELLRGELRKPQAALLPIVAAVGGMIVPALLFWIINRGYPDNLSGWAIPIATDIAFAVAVLSLLGKKVSSSLKTFLLSLAIVDDIGAIIVIALFYGSGIKFLPVAAIVAIMLTIVILREKSRLLTPPFFVLIGLLLWFLAYQSGIHPAIAGIFLAVIVPIGAKNTASTAEQLEKLSIPLSTFVVLPLFAFSSLGIPITFSQFEQASAIHLGIGVAAGLLLGKVVGVTLACLLLVRTRVARLPKGASWYQMVGIGFIAGIGFTVSIFISELAFSDVAQINTAKLCIVAASTLSALVGYFLLREQTQT